MRRRAGMVSLALAALSWALYAGGLQNAPVVDDAAMVTANPYIRSLARLPEIFSHDLWTTSGQSEVGSHYRPMFLVACALNRLIAGGGVASYHAGNIVLHGAVCVALF